MWDIAVGIISNAVWAAICKLANKVSQERTIWKGTIEDLYESGVYQKKTWDKPILINGTFSEYVPFVNLPSLLPLKDPPEKISRIGTCRLGDCIMNNRYIGVIHLPNEDHGASPAIPIFYSGTSKLCSPLIQTGDQIKLKCRLTALDSIWRRILFTGKNIYGFELLPYGLEVIDVDLMDKGMGDFWIDSWWLYSIDKSPEKLKEYWRNICNLPQTRRFAPEDFFKEGEAAISDPWDTILALNELMTDGLVMQRMDGEFSKPMEVLSAVPSKENPICDENLTTNENTSFYITSSINAKDINMVNTYAEMNPEDGLSIISNYIYDITKHFDSMKKPPKKYRALERPNVSLEFQYDQLKRNRYQKLKTRDLINISKN